MIVLEDGAEDFNAEEEMFEIITVVETFGEVWGVLEVAGFEFTSTEITMIPDNMVPTSMEGVAKVQQLIDMLEENDDVYHNAEYQRNLRDWVFEGIA